MPGEDTHGLRAQLAVALKERDEARAGRDAWKEACRKTEQERDSRDWTGMKSERDALRAALQDIVTLCMDVADTPDWRAKVGDKARKALHGEPGWKET